MESEKGLYAVTLPRIVSGDIAAGICFKFIVEICDF